MLEISINYTEEGQAAVRRLRELPHVLPRLVARVIDHQNQFTVGHIQKTKLSEKGPLTLGVITNRLRGSIRASRAQIVGSGDQIVSGIGTNVVYAGVHEFGYEGDQTVSEHRRKGHTVRSFTRHVKIKQRAPIRHGLEERLQSYADAIGKAVIIQANQGGQV